MWSIGQLLKKGELMTLPVRKSTFCRSKDFSLEPWIFFERDKVRQHLVVVVLTVSRLLHSDEKDCHTHDNEAPHCSQILLLTDSIVVGQNNETVLTLCSHAADFICTLHWTIIELSCASAGACGPKHWRITILRQERSGCCGPSLFSCQGYVTTRGRFLLLKYVAVQRDVSLFMYFL